MLGVAASAVQQQYVTWARVTRVPGLGVVYTRLNQILARRLWVTKYAYKAVRRVHGEILAATPDWPTACFRHQTG